MVENGAALLIVEDDLDIAEMLEMFFRTQEYSTRQANCGEDAVRLATDTTPDLVILDIRLPDIDGFEVASRLRENPKTAQIPIIFLTDARELADRLRGQALKADDYITKPFDLQELLTRVETALKVDRKLKPAPAAPSAQDRKTVIEHLTNALQEGKWAALIVRLTNFSEFQTAYGKIAAENLIRATGVLLQASAYEVRAGMYLGQLNTVQFGLLTLPQSLSNLKDYIRKNLDASIENFYRDQDRGQISFQGERIAVHFGELSASGLPVPTMDDLKKELERICH